MADAKRGKAPSLKSVVQMMSDILKGLEHLHAVRPHPVIHRDLKPDNILLQGGIPRLTDFGISRVLRTTSFTQHRSGTPSYMAPEVFSGKYNERTDLWAVGVIFYQLLTGALPFPQQDLHELIGALVMGRRAPLPASLPTNVRDILERAFQKDPAARYASAEAMRKEIEALLYAPPPPPAPTPRPDPTPTRPPQLIQTPTPAPSPQPASTSRRSFLLGIVATGVTVGGVYAASAYWQAKDKTPSGHAGDPQPPPGGGQSGTSTGAKSKPTPPDGADLVWIPPGTFQMGGNGEYDGKPIHEVTLSGFWMYTKPVTVAQFRKYCDSGQYNRDHGKDYDWNSTSLRPPWGWLDDYPMVSVSWTEAAAYAKWAGVTLPTEAQWEYAARGGLAGKNYPWGDDWDGSKCANSVGTNNLNSTKPVGSYAPNGYGLYDMAGNVWEWCSDWYSSDYYKTPAARGPNPTGPENGSSRVLRGGSWGNNLEVVFRCAYRFVNDPADRNYYYGFRCCSPG